MRALKVMHLAGWTADLRLGANAQEGVPVIQLGSLRVIDHVHHAPAQPILLKAPL